MFVNDSTMQSLYLNYASLINPITASKITAADVLASLSEQIIGQQLSTKAADSIFKRVLQVVDIYSTTSILNSPEQDLRNAGLSFAKINYLKNLAEHIQNNQQVYDTIQTFTDQQILELLTSVKGIGLWTAQMFLIFTLGRPDVFSSGDLVLRKSIDKHYPGTSPGHALKGQKEYDKFAEKWAPNRTLACRLLWLAWDTK